MSLKTSINSQYTYLSTLTKNTGNESDKSKINQKLVNYHKEHNQTLNQLFCKTCEDLSWLLSPSDDFSINNATIVTDSDSSDDEDYAATIKVSNSSDEEESAAKKCALFACRAACITCAGCKAIYQKNILKPQDQIMK